MSVRVGGCGDFYYCASASLAAIKIWVTNTLECPGHVRINNLSRRSNGVIGKEIVHVEEIRVDIACQYIVMLEKSHQMWPIVSSPTFQ